MGILLELKGVSVKEIKASLDQASGAEAHINMRNRITELKLQLEVNALDKSSKQINDFSFSSSFNFANITLVELGIINAISTYFNRLARQICKIEGAKSRAEVFDGIVAIPSFT